MDIGKQGESGRHTHHTTRHKAHGRRRKIRAGIARPPKTPVKVGGDVSRINLKKPQLNTDGIQAGSSPARVFTSYGVKTDERTIDRL